MEEFQASQHKWHVKRVEKAAQERELVVKEILSERILQITNFDETIIGKSTAQHSVDAESVVKYITDCERMSSVGDHPPHSCRVRLSSLCRSLYLCTPYILYSSPYDLVSR